MTKQELQQLKETLVSLRANVTKQLDSVKKKEMDANLKDEDGDLSGYSFHLADQGTDTNDRERRFLGAQRDGELLHELDDALDKIDNGTYGQCESCENIIGHSRLEALPYARLCIACKAKEEENPIYPSDQRAYSRRMMPSQEADEYEDND